MNQFKCEDSFKQFRFKAFTYVFTHIKLIWLAKLIIKLISYRKRNFVLVICIAKNFIWTTLKMIFSIFRFFLHPQIPDLQILSKPYINGNIIYSAFRWCINLNFQTLTLKTGFVLQCHIYIQWGKKVFSQGFFICHMINYTGYNQKWNVHQIRSAQWTVQKNKKWYESNTTQEHIYGKKKEK